MTAMTKAAAMLCGISMLSFATAGMAQQAAPATPMDTAPVPATETQPSPAGASSAPAGGIETSPSLAADSVPSRATNSGGATPVTDDIVVTGSRVVTGANSPTPLTTVSSQQLLQSTPTTLANALYKLPVFAGLPAQQRNPGNSSGNSGANNLNLRSIGAARTLLLFNGLRVPENNVDQIPQMLIQRVDIVTGGASAVYGSDAVAGVVNFVVDKSFEGLRVNGQAGISKYGDNRTVRVGAAAGKQIGRLHLEGSVEHFYDPGVFSKLERPWGREVWSTQGAGTAANPYNLVKDTRISNTSYGGKILSGPLANQNFATNGVLVPFVNGSPTGASTIQSGGDGAFFNKASLITKLKNTQYFGRADYELSDNINVWFQGSYVDTNNKNNHQNNEFRNYTLSATNAFLRPEYQAAMAAANVTTFTFGKMMDQADPLQPETFLDTTIFSGGFDGKFGILGSDWNWNVAGMTSRAKQHTFNNANMDGAKAAAALDAVVNPANGQIVCRVTLTNPSAYPGCVPLNVFGPTSESQAALDYILLKTDFTTITTLKEITASIAGSPFSTWAGPVKLAISGEAREATVKTNSNFQPSDRVDCSSLPRDPASNRILNCSTAANGTSTQARWVSNVVASLPKQSVSVREVAVETDIPLLVDAPFAQRFNVNAAARYTDYETSGTVWTWKLGADWQVFDDLRLRATRSRDILAPSVTQLFGAASVNPSGITDLHTGINAVAPVRTDSNPNLVPEVANTLTAGVVYRPSWLPSFSISVDYYRIKINNGIANVSGNNATVMRICEDSNGASPLCALYIRPLPFADRSPANYPTLILARPENIAQFLSEGVDFEVNYGFDIGAGRVNLRGLMTYTAQQKSQTIPGTTVLDAAGAAGLPSIRGNLQAQYVNGPFRFDLMQRYHNSTRRSDDPTQVWAVGRVAARTYTDVTFAYDVPVFGGTSQLFLSVQNLWNQAPAVHGATGGSSSVPGLFLATTNGDDINGRYFTAGFRFRL